MCQLRYLSYDASCCCGVDSIKTEVPYYFIFSWQDANGCDVNNFTSKKDNEIIFGLCIDSLNRKVEHFYNSYSRGYAVKWDPLFKDFVEGEQIHRNNTEVIGQNVRIPLRVFSILNLQTLYFDVFDYINENQARLHRWFRLEAMRRGYLRQDYFYCAQEIIPWLERRGSVD
jgi:hypothetical protein